ncbi:penicillin acylase family protein [Lysinibacillus sp. NPDC093692]|uniref:penicillin acylase family protein n=1 Tax=Lysinibacillus sp. NPDC093692 TaxID=3390578 RepID=UPI003CFEFA1B
MPKKNTKNMEIDGLFENVHVQFDSYGVPTIKAESLEDSSFVLGYLTARDRLFQMDYQRRESYGELAEILGKVFIDKDKEMRLLDLKKIATKVVEHLNKEELSLLKSYTDGVNNYLETVSIKNSFEFILLDYTPERWTIIDSIAVFLGFFKKLTLDPEDKKMVEVMNNILPKDIVDFLLQDDDCFNNKYLNNANRAFNGIPKEQIISLIKRLKNKPSIKESMPEFILPIGSNAWGKRYKTKQGKYISKIANDMHLPLSVPITWYRAHLKLPEGGGSGIILPGLPAIIAGSSDHLSWGFTRFCGDNMEYLKLESNENEDSYLTEDGWKPFEYEKQLIKVKNSETIEINIKKTIYGNVNANKVLDKNVLQFGSLLDYKAINFSIYKMMLVKDVDEGIQVMKEFGGPPMNVIIGDDKGNIGWTVCGKILKNTNKDLLGMVNWDEYKSRNVYLHDSEKPEIINPTVNYVVSANNRIIGSESKNILGNNYFNGYRFYRITNLLRNEQPLSANLKCESMENIQNDTYGEFYFYYRDLIFESMTKKNDDFSKKILHMLDKWDNNVQKNSQYFSMLVVFHENLVKKVIEPLVSEAKEIQPDFLFAWNNIETPLRAILSEKNCELIYTEKEDFDDFIIDTCKEAYEQLRSNFKWNGKKALRWGKTNKTFIFNILSFYYQEFWSVFNMPVRELEGCQNTVNVSWPGFGASVRFISIPGEKVGLISIPGGQSSHPLSKNYRDHFKKWINGEYINLYPESSVYELNFYKKE